MATKTEQKIADMLTENTGTHLLDSGGTSGRNWQRNQGLTVDMFKQSPEAIFAVNEWGWEAEINIFHYLNARVFLSYRAEELQRQFVSWIEEDSERNPWSCSDMEDWAKEVTDTDTGLESVCGEIFNTYNWENYLSQTLQGVQFTIDGVPFVLLQIHGGADVRGGYTHPQVFELHSEGMYFLVDSQDLFFGCADQDCDLEAFLQNYYAETNDGEEVDLDTIKNGCPRCGGKIFTASLPEPCY